MLKRIKDLEKVARPSLSSGRSSGQTTAAGSGGIVEQDIKE